MICLQKCKLQMERLLAVGIASCLFMKRNNVDFVSLSKTHLKKPNLLSNYWFTHQQDLGTKKSEDFWRYNKQVVKTVKYTQTTKHSHWLLYGVPWPINADLSALYHSEARWLSKGKVENRFPKHQHKIMVFHNEYDNT
jgi:hypothetical protein